MNASPFMDFRLRCSIRRLLALALLAFFTSVTNAADDQTSRQVTAVEVGTDSSAAAGGAAATGTQLATAPAETVTAHTGGIRRIDIGAATGDLLTMQRKSEGVRPRPIDGEQASRSYQRYLKSFETSIPERFDTGLEIKKQ